MAAVFNSRSRKASASARGGRQEAIMAMIPGVTAAYQAVSGHQSLSTSSWEPEHLGSTKGPTTQGEQPLGICMTCLRLWQAPTGLSWSQWALPKHPNCVCHTPLSLPQLSKPALISCYYHLLVSGWRTDTESGLQGRRAQNQSRALGSV